MTSPTSTAPSYRDDLFTDEAIRNPYEHYRAIREAGPLVWLAQTGIHAAGRYDDVRAALRDHDTFVSGHGVAISEFSNRVSRGNTLASDPPLHDHLRKVVAHRLTPRALRDQRAGIAAAADKVVTRALEIGDIDGIVDIAQAMPLSVVPDFIGIPEDCRDRLIPWAQAGLDAFGPPNDRTAAAATTASELVAYMNTLVAEVTPPPGSLIEDLFTAADRGEIESSQCPSLLRDYFSPSIETTVSALGSALALFARNPDQWDLFRRDPSLVGGTFNEVLRLESPLRGFTRIAAVDTMIGDTEIAAGERVWLLYASANRDERQWDRPDDFDIARDNAHHLGLGYGVHSCAGQGLARLEVGAVLTRLAESVVRLELLAEPEHLINSLARTYSTMSLRLHTA